MNVVNASFKPEFLNRLDDVILFDPLSTSDLSKIVDIQVAQLAERLGQRRLRLEVTPAATEWLGLTGYDPAYGARPLRRLVQREIGDKLARAILSGAVVDGDAVRVDVDADVVADGLTVTAVSERAHAAD
jgi:ATP-dependent Clp protease ATP-binding subunit ClpB